LPLLLAGCARHYVMTLNSGAHITTLGKPKLQNGAYLYKDVQGQAGVIPAGRVAEIAPASMVPERKEPFKPKTSR
jgi:hypothetical protein